MERLTLTRDIESMIYEGRIDELKTLVAADPRLVHATDEHGTTLLILAARYGAREIVKELLAHGADASHLDGTGSTPLHAVLEARLEERGDPAGVLDVLLQHHADTNRIGINSYSPLHFAVRHGMLTEVQRMLEHGADPNLPAADCDCWTPLIMAAKSGHRELLELLRKHGARY